MKEKLTAKEFALYAVRGWSQSDEFPGHPFPGLVEYIELAITNAMEQATSDSSSLLRACEDALLRAHAALSDGQHVQEAIQETWDVMFRVRAALPPVVHGFKP